MNRPPGSSAAPPSAAGARPTRILTPLVLLWLLVLLPYSNTFQVPWHFDDYSNILENRALHLTDLQPASLAATLSANPKAHPQSQRLYRPVACLSFALNWYGHGGRMTGYHLVNLAVHWTTAVLLFLSILALYRTPRLAGRTRQEAEFTALLGAALWAVNPVQTMAVTYIVQRMASLAAMFYLAGLWCYLRGRSHPRIRWRPVWFAGTLTAYLLALGSKENSVLLPVALILVDAIFYRSGRLRLRRFIGWPLAAVGLTILGTLWLLGPNITSIWQGYGDRVFTPVQRLMTEARVLIFYLSQLALPLADRLSFVHDFVLSTTPLRPWTTLPAIGALLVVAWGAIRGARKYPLLSFGALFFLINHLPESTILPLEIIFEHRCYLPSLFLFAPVAVGIHTLLRRWQQQRWAYISVVVACILLLAGWGNSTYWRNAVWRSERSLWEDALAKAPGSFRPAHNLAWSYYHRIGRDDVAIQLYRLSLDRRAAKPRYARSQALSNMAAIYFRHGSFVRARDLLEKALAINPNLNSARYNLALVLGRQGQWEDALTQAKLLVGRRSDPAYLELQGFALIRLGRFEEALEPLLQAFVAEPSGRKVLMDIGYALGRLESTGRADQFLKRAARIHPPDASCLLVRIENSLRAGKREQARLQVREMLAALSWETIRKELDSHVRDPLRPQLEVERIVAALLEVLEQEVGHLPGSGSSAPAAGTP